MGVIRILRIELRFLIGGALFSPAIVEEDSFGNWRRFVSLGLPLLMLLADTEAILGFELFLFCLIVISLILVPFFAGATTAETLSVVSLFIVGASELSFFADSAVVLISDFGSVSKILC
jgi:hypothetical protein